MFKSCQLPFSLQRQLKLSPCLAWLLPIVIYLRKKIYYFSFCFTPEASMTDGAKAQKSSETAEVSHKSEGVTVL